MEKTPFQMGFSVQKNKQKSQKLSPLSKMVEKLPSVFSPCKLDFAQELKVFTDLEVKGDGIYGDNLSSGIVLQGTSQEGLREEETRNPVDLEIKENFMVLNSTMEI